MSESPFLIHVQGVDEAWPVSSMSGREALSTAYRFDAVLTVRTAVIAARTKGDPLKPIPITDDDIYFVSRMFLMWDADNSTRNFSISRLLWAFRDTPYYKDLQAFWIVHAPQGALAEVMWEEGARDRSLEEIIDDALERHNEYANSKPIDPSKQKNRMPGEGPRDKLTTGLDTRTVAVLSHDDTGQALHIWMAHQLKALVGSGSPPKVIRDLFINTGAPSLDLVMKRNQALKAAQDAEFARRARKANEIQSELARHPGPERTKELRDEFAALLAPPDDSDDPIEQAKKNSAAARLASASWPATAFWQVTSIEPCVGIRASGSPICFRAPGQPNNENTHQDSSARNALAGRVSGWRNRGGDEREHHRSSLDLGSGLRQHRFIEPTSPK